MQNKRQSHLQEAIVLTKEEQYDAARVIYQRLLEEDAGLLDAWYGLGYCHYRLGYLSQAVPALTRAAEMGHRAAVKLLPKVEEKLMKRGQMEVAKPTPLPKEPKQVCTPDNPLLPEGLSHSDGTKEDPGGEDAPVLQPEGAETSDGVVALSMEETALLHNLHKKRFNALLMANILGSLLAGLVFSGVPHPAIFGTIYAVVVYSAYLFLFGVHMLAREDLDVHVNSVVHQEYCSAVRRRSGVNVSRFDNMGCVQALFVHTVGVVFGVFLSGAQRGKELDAFLKNQPILAAYRATNKRSDVLNMAPLVVFVGGLAITGFLSSIERSKDAEEQRFESVADELRALVSGDEWEKLRSTAHSHLDSSEFSGSEESYFQYYAGYASYRLGDYGDSAVMLEKALQEPHASLDLGEVNFVALAAFVEIDADEDALSRVDVMLAMGDRLKPQLRGAALRNRASINTKHGSLHNGLADWLEIAELVRKHGEEEFTDTNIAWVYSQIATSLATHPDARMRDGKRALEFARMAYRKTRDDAKGYVYSALAAAYAELGYFDDAVKWQKEAIALNRRGETAGGERLRAYENYQPWRISP